MKELKVSEFNKDWEYRKAKKELKKKRKMKRKEREVKRLGCYD